MSLRRALSTLLVLPVVIALGCSSKNDAPPPVPAAPSTVAAPGQVANQPSPGPVTAPSGAGADALAKARPEAAELERKAAVIRPTAAEVRWKQIPWMTSVVEARKAAQAEKRPILMWISDDDPLDRC